MLWSFNRSNNKTLVRRDQHLVTPLIQLAILGILMAPLLGCIKIGPRVVQSSQLDYNQALANGVQQELLLNIVRLRYREAPYFLLPGNLTTSFKSSGSLGLNGEFDLDSNGNMLSPSTGFGFSSSPTVVYTPLQGKEFVRDLMTPIDPRELFLLDESGWSIKRVFGLAIERINTLENAPSASGPTPATKPPGLDEFNAFIDQLSQLQLEQSFGYLRNKQSGDISIFLNANQDNTQKVGEVRSLLGLKNSQSQIILNDERTTQEQLGISITTRSLLGILFYLSHNVEAPAEHEEAGRVTVTQDLNAPFDWSTSPAGRYFKVHYSKRKPSQAFLSVSYKGGFYYISENDLDTKSTFLLLLHLQSLQAGKNDDLPKPTLTIPIGG